MSGSVPTTVLLGVLSLLGGCGSGGGGPAKTPADAIRHFSKAIASGDKNLFLATVETGDAKDRELAAAVFDMMSEAWQYNQAMEKAYGKGAAGDLAEEAPVLTEEEIARLQIKTEGDKAVAIDPYVPGLNRATLPTDANGTPLPGRTLFELVRRDGQWKVDLSWNMPKNAIRVEQAKAVAKAFAEVRGKIGKEGMTKERIQFELQQAVMKAAAGEL